RLINKCRSRRDGMVGNRSEFRQARNRAIELVNDADKAKLGKDAAGKLDEKDWLDESHAIAEAIVYDAELTGFLRGHAEDTQAPSVHLSDRYLKDGGAVAEQQVIKGGYRLGTVLKQIADVQK